MLARRALHSAFFMAMALVSAHVASGAEVWVARGGTTTFHFNVDLMHDLGIQVSDMQDTVASPPGTDFRIEEPFWTFGISPDSDLRFQVNNGIAVPYGVLGGALQFGGSIVLRVNASDVTLRHFNISYVPATVSGPAGTHPSDVLHFGAEGTATPVVCDIDNSMLDFHKSEGVLHIHYMNFRITPEWAASIGRPDLGGWTIGMADGAVTAEKVGGISSGPVHDPVFTGHLDVELGNVDGIQEVAHDGTYPAGTAALSLATTACNVGDTDVPWHAPMATDHPTIAMALYRMLNGRLEQVGVSWMKHGFYALSNNDCSICQDHSDGTYLGIGCSDTYGVSNNSDRTYLGPRSEVNGYKGTWNCVGSHFSGGVPDCVRRHGSAGHGPLDHRLVAQDADLNLPGATYYYEGYYVVADDIDRSNNIGSKICTMSWNGSVWNFQTPTVNNPLVTGPTINRFGELRTEVPVGDADGNVILAVQTTDLGFGRYHYEYALFNLNSDLQIGAVTIPIGADSSITNIGFHDSDPDPTNDWQVTIQNGTIRWSTDTYQNNPSANSLGFGLMFNFRFDSSQPPSSINADLGVFKPGGPTDVSAATLGPVNPAAVGGTGTASGFRLGLARPNPTTGATTIPFELSRSAAVDLSIYDPTGRKVRTLLHSTMDAGSHQLDWDGSDAAGRSVPAGVYYYRLRAGMETAVRSVTRMK